ncbi:MAG: hypothetical protein DYH08_06245 [Actinobacteria bacterium ATB1]|nr:hypothetical protein [Actinobacteria bacterium ATB1]
MGLLHADLSEAFVATSVIWCVATSHGTSGTFSVPEVGRPAWAPGASPSTSSSTVSAPVVA